MASNVVSVLAPAKINLYLDILSKRADGYHEILTVFQTLDLHDKLTFEFSAEDNLQVIHPGSNEIKICLLEGQDFIEKPLFPLDGENSISQAIKIFLAALPDKPAIKTKVEIEKNIPIGAGLAGGSTDAAATLVALNHYFNNPITNDKLLDLASQIGSDVSFCLLGGTAIGRGRGEQLEALAEKPKYYFVLVKPRSLSVSTPWAYEIYDQFIESQNADEVNRHSLSKLLLALKYDSKIETEADLFWNAFQQVIFKEYPILAEIQKRLLDFGCLSVHLAGSGPTVCGLVRNEEEGQRILKEIKSISIEKNANSQSNREIVIDAWLTKTMDKGANILPSKVKQGK
jgi:4-diphosphocytidyl-2-C-methyl-D-erythritol kinase